MTSSQLRNQAVPSSNETLDQWYQMSLTLIHGWCSVFTLPVEYAIRPLFGTRYFNPIVVGLSFFMMMALPILAQLLSGVTALLSFGFSRPQTHGFIGVGMLSIVFLIGSAIHGLRLWRRMLYPETEYYGEWEGPPLPCFLMLPKGKCFWIVRIIYEPLFVVAVSASLSHLRVLDHFAANYLNIAALLLFFKMWIEWYKHWLRLRILMDSEVSASLLARYLRGNASDEDLAIIHMAKPPQGTPSVIVTRANAAMAEALPPDLQRLVTPLQTQAPASSSTSAEPAGATMGTPSPSSLFSGTKPTVLMLIALGVAGAGATGLRVPAVLAAGPVRPEAQSSGQSGGPRNANAPTLRDISGVWVNTIEVRPGITATYRMEFTQTGSTITGRSRRELKGPFDSAFGMFAITGSSLEGGKRFVLHEGVRLGSYPIDRPWCAMRLLTLVPTPDGGLWGSYEAPPCQNGSFVLRRAK